MSVGVMKDYKLKLRDLHASHTLGWLGNVHYRDGRDSRFADAGGIAERVAFCRYN